MVTVFGTANPMTDLVPLFSCTLPTETRMVGLEYAPQKNATCLDDASR